MRRVIGQCNQVDFVSIEHLASVTEDLEKLDTSTLTNRQKFAFHFITLTIRKKIPWRMLKLVQEVLFWGVGSNVSGVEIKFIRDSSKRDEITDFKQLWRKVM